MSNKIMKKDLATTAKNLTETAKKLQTKAINTSETLVEETIAAGEQWQEVMEKALKGGVDIFAKQQDLTFTTLEAVKAQYLSGNDRMVKLLGLKGFNFNQWTNTFFNKTKKVSAIAANKVSTTILTAEEKIKSEAIKQQVEQTKIKATATVPTATTVVEKAAKTVAVAAKETTAAVKKTVNATTDTAKKSAKATVETAKKTAKTATAKVVEATEKAGITKDNLTIIEGIGPKVEEVLNNAGIFTYQDLSLRTSEELENILVTANPAYKRFQPTTWAAQAKFAAEGKMDELSAWQNELKGGQIVFA